MSERTEFYVKFFRPVPQSEAQPGEGDGALPQEEEREADECREFKAYFIYDASIVEDILEVGFVCNQKTPLFVDGGAWYETNCPLRHDVPYVLGRGLIIRKGALVERVSEGEVT